MSMTMKRKKRNRIDRAFAHGFKAGIRGHEMESCPYGERAERGSWFSGWRIGRENYLSGTIVILPDEERLRA